MDVFAPSDAAHPVVSSIAGMPPWHFWSCPRAVGSTARETSDAAAGRLPEERFAELRSATEAAFLRLRDWPVDCPRWWAPHWKLVN